MLLRLWSFLRCDFLPNFLTVAFLFWLLQVNKGLVSRRIREHTYAHASAYYSTMGYAVPAALGVGIADPHRWPVAVVGEAVLEPETNYRWSFQ